MFSSSWASFPRGRSPSQPHRALAFRPCPGPRAGKAGLQAQLFLLEHGRGSPFHKHFPSKGILSQEGFPCFNGRKSGPGSVFSGCSSCLPPSPLPTARARLAWDGRWWTVKNGHFCLGQIPAQTQTAGSPRVSFIFNSSSSAV